MIGRAVQAPLGLGIIAPLCWAQPRPCWSLKRRLDPCIQRIKHSSNADRCNDDDHADRNAVHEVPQQQTAGRLENMLMFFLWHVLSISARHVVRGGTSLCRRGTPQRQTIIRLTP